MGTTGFMIAKEPRNSYARERNILLVLLLCLPECKAKQVIEAYENYMLCQCNLKNFIAINLKKVVEGKFDEALQDERVIKRIKDMCVRSSDYASKPNKKLDKYTEKLNFSLKGLIENERGTSLYKINKALSKFI